MTTLIILALVSGLVASIAIWKAAEHSGRVKERNDILEGEIENARKRAQIETDVARMSDDDVTKRLSKWKRSK